MGHVFSRGREGGDILRCSISWKIWGEFSAAGDEMRYHVWWFLFVCLLLTLLRILGLFGKTYECQYYSGMKYGCYDPCLHVRVRVYLFALPSLKEMSMFDVDAKMQICTYYRGTYMVTPHLNWEN